MSKLISATEARSNMKEYWEVHRKEEPRENIDVKRDYFNYIYDEIKKSSEEGKEYVDINTTYIRPNVIDELTSILENKGYKVTGKVGDKINVSWMVNGELDIINDLKNINESLVGKIYYIRSYVYNSKDIDNTGAGVIINHFVPHMVIGINHDGTENTMDLRQMVTPMITYFDSKNNRAEYGDYRKSYFYTYIRDQHPNGYSKTIRHYMKEMVENFRVPTGIADKTGLKGARRTDCKLLNPVELFGARSFDILSPMYDDLDATYGEIYEAFLENTKNRICYKDLECNGACGYWTNSYADYFSPGGYGKSSYCFRVDNTGVPEPLITTYKCGIAPVIRLGLK